MKTTPKDPPFDQVPPAEPKAKGQCEGLILVHPAGYGFVQRDDGEDDVFVSARNRGVALDGDRVRLTTWMGYKGREGKVVAILARGRARLTGVIQEQGGRRPVRVLVPDDPRLLGQHTTIVLPEGSGKANPGQSVLAEITVYPSHPQEPLSARVLRVLGQPEELPTELLKILVCADIPQDFPEEVAQAGHRAPTEVRPEDLVDRLDLRDRPFLTIDPENARDFDDAICVEEGAGGRPGGPKLDRLWVAVADVSHYVRHSIPLDQEARVRGCSVYLPDRVIPMLPLQLSSGICSLNPDVDRLAVVVALDIDRSGQVQDARPAAAVIRSHGRLDYGGVAQALSAEGSHALRGNLGRYRDHLPHLRLLADVAGRLRTRRLLRGALDFELPEARVQIGEDGQVRDVVRSRQSPQVRDAYRLVEDCMLAANEAIARYFLERDLPAVFRVHEIPDDERLTAFAALAQSHGLTFDPKEAQTPLYLKQFLEQLRGRPMEQALSYLLLRALKKAHYTIDNVGHFGLAAPAYLHFTSPIRRYPDLLCHRLLKKQLRREGLPAGGRDQDGIEEAELTRFAADSSQMERRAMEVEREVVDLYRAYLMNGREGDEFDGTIVGITAFGIFVALDAPYVEGLIKTDNLGGGYTYDEKTVSLSRPSGFSFHLGDRVRVGIAAVSVTRRKIDLTFLGKLSASEVHPPTERGKGRPPKGESKRDKRVPKQEAKPESRPPGKRDGKKGRSDKAASPKGRQPKDRGKTQKAKSPKGDKNKGKRRVPSSAKGRPPRAKPGGGKGPP